MKFIFGVFLLLFGLAGYAEAYQLVVTETDVPYEVVPMVGEVREMQAYLGKLDDYPVMYELTSEEPFTFTAQLQQRYHSGAEPTPFSFIIIRQNDRGGGVTEVTRLNPKADDWTRIKSSKYGMSFWVSTLVSEEVEPGIYRIEVSTPENIGTYQLVYGEGESDAGYFESLGHIWTTQQFFGLSFMSMLLSSYVYYPLGILLLLAAIHRTWKLRNKIINAPQAANN